MADLAPVGMFHIDREGVLMYANHDYYKITGYPIGDSARFVSIECIASGFNY